MSNKQEIPSANPAALPGCRGSMPAHDTHTRCSACRKKMAAVTKPMAERTADRLQREHDAMVHKRRENMDIGDPVSLFLNPHITWLVR